MKGLTSRMNLGWSAAVTPSMASQALGGSSGPGRSSSRRCMAFSCTPGRQAAVTAKAGVSSSSRPAPMTPPPLQPSRWAGFRSVSRLSWMKLKASRWWGETNTNSASGRRPASPRASSSVHSATAASGSISSLTALAK